MAILRDEPATNKHIFNIGNPANVCSIEELAFKVQKSFSEVTGKALRTLPPPEYVNATEYYGIGFQDITHRRPDISKAKSLLQWNPNIPIEVSIRSAVEYFVQSNTGTPSIEKSDKRA